MNAKYAVAAAVIVIAVCAAYVAYSMGEDGTGEDGDVTVPEIPGTDTPDNDVPDDGDSGDEDMSGTIKMEANGRTFTVQLEDNETARALCRQLPMTVTMTELNGNEKYHYGENLPADPRRVGTIHAGDIMLFGDDCLVVFYETFSTSYSYTPIGHITDTTGLRDALGSGNVTVTFS